MTLSSSSTSSTVQQQSERNEFRHAANGFSGRLTEIVNYLSSNLRKLNSMATFSRNGNLYTLEPIMASQVDDILKKLKETDFAYIWQTLKRSELIPGHISHKLQCRMAEFGSAVIGIEYAVSSVYSSEEKASSFFATQMMSTRAILADIEELTKQF